MSEAKEIINFLLSPWTQNTPEKFRTLITKYTSNQKTSILILAVLLQIPGVNTIAYNELKKNFYYLTHTLLSLPPAQLNNFWKDLVGFVQINPQLEHFLNQFTSILKYSGSSEIFPYIISLRNITLLSKFILLQDEDNLKQAATNLLSSDDVHLVSQVFPLILEKNPNLIYMSIVPVFRPQVLTSCLLSNWVGNISEKNVSLILALVKDGYIKQNTEIYYAFCYYMKKHFIPRLNIPISSNDLIQEIVKTFPNIMKQKSMQVKLAEIVDKAKNIVKFHRVDEIEKFAQDLLNGNDNEKTVACLTISALIITYPIEKNVLINLLLMLKSFNVNIEFPEFLAEKLLRSDFNQLEKLKQKGMIFTILIAIIKSQSINLNLSNTNDHDLIDIIKGIFIAATSNYCRSKSISITQELASILYKINFTNAFKNNKSSLKFFHSKILNNFDFTSKNAVQLYDEILKSTEAFPPFKINKMFNQKLELFFSQDDDDNDYENDQINDDIMKGANITMVGLEMPNFDNEFDEILLKSGYQDSLCSPIGTISNDFNEEDIAKFLISNTGIA